ncbi:MAG: hypothetical protein ACI944_001776, partial [Natronomonas sp.]
MRLPTVSVGRRYTDRDSSANSWYSMSFERISLWRRSR